MAYPTDTGQSYTTIDGTDNTGATLGDGLTHSERHTKVQEEVTALKNKVGIDNDTDENSLDYKIRNIALEIYPVGSIYLSINNTDPGTLFGGAWEEFGSGRTLVGVDEAQTEFDTVEETGGAKTHTLTSSEMPSHTHTQNSHNHTQNAHTHTQNSHNHTQNAHTHTQNAHTHTQNAHTHTQNAHEHYTWVHANGTQFMVDGNGTGPSVSGFAPNLTGTTNKVMITTKTTATNRNTTATNRNTTATNRNTTATNQATTATNNNTTATNQATTATNQNTGGGGAHNNLQPYITVYMWKRTA